MNKELVENPWTILTIEYNTAVKKNDKDLHKLLRSNT